MPKKTTLFSTHSLFLIDSVKRAISELAVATPGIQLGRLRVPGGVVTVVELDAVVPLLPIAVAVTWWVPEPRLRPT